MGCCQLTAIAGQPSGPAPALISPLSSEVFAAERRKAVSNGAFLAQSRTAASRISVSGS
jgi:hypothetical protein